MTLADDLRGAVLTSELTHDQLTELIDAGQVVTFATGDVLFREGRPADELWILLDGEIELARRIADQTIVVATMSTRGQWAGGFTAWGDADASSGYRATGTALTDGRFFCVPSRELGRLVGAWSPFSKHIIGGVFQTVRAIDATARQRESLVALGTLAAGLAHEINNPAAAILRSVEALNEACGYMLAALVDLAEDGVTAEQFIALDRLRLELQERDVVDDGSIAIADREEEIGERLERRAIDHAWAMAPVFASVGTEDDWFERLEAVVGHVAVGPALHWVSSTIGSGALMTEIVDATNRIAHLVKDVKAYSQMDRSDLHAVDVHEGIERTLTMLRAKLTRVEVTRDFDPDLPKVEMYADELRQVWTNLIENAVDAMEGRGTLRLVTRRDGDDVVVEITDSGKGMPADVQARAFEPFFTTKDVGKGTGLGLDISRRIVVDRHAGDISFESAPGSTTARVRLPIKR